MCTTCGKLCGFSAATSKNRGKLREFVLTFPHFHSLGCGKLPDYRTKLYRCTPLSLFPISKKLSVFDRRTRFFYKLHTPKSEDSHKHAICKNSTANPPVFSTKNCLFSAMGILSIHFLPPRRHLAVNFSRCTPLFADFLHFLQGKPTPSGKNRHFEGAQRSTSPKNRKHAICVRFFGCSHRDRVALCKTPRVVGMKCITDRKNIQNRD